MRRTPIHRRPLALLGLILSAFGIVLGFASLPAQADSSSASDPRAVFYGEANATTCADVWSEGTWVGSGTATDASDAYVTGDVHDDDDRYLDVTAAPGVVVEAIVVKGGSGFNLYLPGFLGLSAAGPWTELISPLNGGGNIPSISHWFACYRVDAVCPDGSPQSGDVVPCPPPPCPEVTAEVSAANGDPCPPPPCPEVTAEVSAANGDPCPPPPCPEDVEVTTAEGWPPPDDCEPPPCVDDPETEADECNPCVDDPATPGDECNPCVDDPATPGDECNPCVDDPATPADECGPVIPNRVAACVAGRNTVERFTATDVFSHLDGEFAVSFAPGTNQWTSKVPIDFMMVVEDNTTIRSFRLPAPATSGSFTVDSVTIVLNGSTIVVPGVITDAAGNPISTAAVGTITQVTFCSSPATEIGGLQQTRVLARTGAESTPTLLLAIGLVVTGAGLVLFGADHRMALATRRF
jgi:hypothetical protein